MQSRTVWLMGGSGSGKSTVSEMLREQGFIVEDADKISKAIMKKGKAAYNETVEVFGNEILAEDGEINRRCLGEIVFSDAEKLRKLNEITHKYIKAELQSAVQAHELTVIDAALPPKGFLECDLTVLVTADESVRLERIKRRDNLSEQAAKNRLLSQLSEEEYRESADYVVENNGDVTQLREAVKKLVEKINEKNN